jgi:hypothetical protein
MKYPNYIILLEKNIKKKIGGNNQLNQKIPLNKLINNSIVYSDGFNNGI